MAQDLTRDYAVLEFDKLDLLALNGSSDAVALQYNVRGHSYDGHATPWAQAPEEALHSDPFTLGVPGSHVGEGAFGSFGVSDSSRNIVYSAPSPVGLRGWWILPCSTRLREQRPEKSTAPALSHRSTVISWRGERKQNHKLKNYSVLIKMATRRGPVI